jgi:hypothetical protein
MTKKFNLDAIENQTARFISGVKRPAAEAEDAAAQVPMFPASPANAEATRDNPDALTAQVAPPAPDANRPGRPKVKNREVRSMRINVLIRPSIVERLKKVGAIKRKSVNDLINTYLDERLKQEADALKRFDEVFGGEGQE